MLELIRLAAKAIVSHRLRSVLSNHEDHLHVRFVCPYSDLKCRP